MATIWTTRGMTYRFRLFEISVSKAAKRGKRWATWWNRLTGQSKLLQTNLSIIDGERLCQVHTCLNMRLTKAQIELKRHVQGKADRENARENCLNFDHFNMSVYARLSDWYTAIASVSCLTVTNALTPLREDIDALLQKDLFVTLQHYFIYKLS